MKHEKHIKKLLYLLLVIFSVLVAYFAIPFSQEWKRMLFPVAVVLFSFFLIGGFIIFYCIYAYKPRDWLKRSLLLTGVSAVGIPISVVLHNLVYGLLIYFFGPNIWDTLGLPDEAFFFIMALFIFPLLFLVGCIESIILIKKKKY